MLKPVMKQDIPQLLHLFAQFQDCPLVFGKLNIEQFLNNSNIYQYIAIDNQQQIIGYFAYELFPVNAENKTENGACNLRIANLSNNSNLFAKEFYNLITQIIFAPNNNTIRLTFYCYLDNPIIQTYRRFAHKYGEVCEQTNTYEKYRVYRNKLFI